LVVLFAVTVTRVLALMVVSGAPVPISVGTVRVTLEPPPVAVETVPCRPWADTV